jgi:hypothetical protein
MKNYLIVESQNDKFFIDALINHLNLTNVKVSDATICNIDDYEYMNGLDHKKLCQAIGHVKDESEKSSESFNLGIIIDWDDKTLEDRLELVNTAIVTVFENTNSITATNELLAVSNDFNIACYFNGIDKKGELETVLKHIKSEVSTYADCLDTWRNCLAPSTVSQKEFDKFWVAQYIRYDTCSKKEKNQVSKYCTLEAAMKKSIWDFKNPCLDELKSFLQLFA